MTITGALNYYSTGMSLNIEDLVLEGRVGAQINHNAPNYYETSQTYAGYDFLLRNITLDDPGPLSNNDNIRFDGYLTSIGPAANSWGIIASDVSGVGATDSDTYHIRGLQLYGANGLLTGFNILNYNMHEYDFVGINLPSPLLYDAGSGPAADNWFSSIDYLNSQPQDWTGFTWNLNQFLSASAAYRAGNAAPLMAILNSENYDLSGSSARDVFHGYALDDTLRGAGGNDDISGRGGNDFISGGAGLDVIYGDAGNDRLYGGDDADTIYGGDGDDRLVGGDGIDQLDGGANNDTFYDEGGFGDGVDVINGGAGIDTVTFFQMGTSVTVDTRTPYLNFAGNAAWTSIENIVGTIYGDYIFLNDTDGVDNFIDGGNGNDRLGGGSGYDTIFGGDGQDTIYGFSGIDDLRGGEGDDKLYGEDGRDVLWGGGGVNEFYGGAGSDIVSYRDATGSVTACLDDYRINDGEALGDIFDSIETIRGGAYADDLLAWDVQAILYGGGGDDRLTGGVSGGEHTDYLYGENGNDTIEGNRGDDFLYGGKDSDRLYGGEGTDNLYGGLGADLHNGGNDPGITDYARYDDANHGNLTIRLDAPNQNSGAAAGDTYVDIQGLVGGVGDDLLVGNGNANYLFGADGDDYIFGQAGADYLNGGEGTNQLAGGAGADRHIGGSGIDYARYNDANWGNLTIRLDAPAANVGAAAVGDTYIGIEGLVGGIGRDVIVGNAANNFLLGGGGADYIDARLGNDYLHGGADADRFVFATALNAASNVDRIADFAHGTDDIIMGRSIFAAIGAALDSSELRFGTAAQDANDFIIYNSATGQLFYDANGNGAGGQTLFATVSAGVVLDTGDFMTQ